MKHGFTISNLRQNNSQTVKTRKIIILEKSQVDNIRGEGDGHSFQDTKGVLPVDYLERGHSMTGRYYADLTRKLRENIKETRHGKLSLSTLFHQDNALAQKSSVAMAATQECGFQPVEHPPYSPDLSHSDLLPIPQDVNRPSGRHFHTDDDVKQAVEAFLEARDATYREDIQMLRHCWTKCVSSQGDYVENTLEY